VEGWHREPGEDNGPDQGFITEYYAAANQMTASVFVYRGGVPNISRDAAVLRGEVERTFTGMQRAVEAGAYQDVRAAGDVELTTFGENGPPAAHQRVVIETTEGTRLSETLVTTHRGFFFKVRVTINVEPTPELTHQLNALYVALGRAVVES
jgi:hypothetical protein